MHTKKSKLNSIEVVQDKVEPSLCLRYLGAWLDESLNFHTHVKKKCATAMWNIHKIRNIREYLDVETCNILCCALVLSHLDYSNRIPSGAASYVLSQMQCIQNIAVKIFLNNSKGTSSTEALKELHWLPVKARVDFKILCIIFQCLNYTGPRYLEDLYYAETRALVKV